MMGDAVRYIEIVSYSLIACIGAAAAVAQGPRLHAPRCAWRSGGHRITTLIITTIIHHDHAHHLMIDHAATYRHAHAEPEDLAGPGGWRRGLAAIVAVGLRPCSGAILVLIFALAQGIFWAGVGATF